MVGWLVGVAALGFLVGALVAVDASRAQAGTGDTRREDVVVALLGWHETLAGGMARRR